MVLPLLLLGACGSKTNDEPASATAGNAGSSNGGKASESILEKLKSQGYATVGFANENPYAYKTADGELTGEAVEIARTVLKRLGINEIRGELTEFSSLIAGLQADRFDLVTAGMFINPERCQAVAFANPEYSIGEGLAVQAGNPLKLTSYKAVASNAKAKVAVMAGAIEIGYLKASGVTEKQMVIVPDQDAALSALQSGRADAITMTGPALQSRLDAAADAKLERVMDFEQPVVDGKSVRGYGATAFRTADTSFRDAYNAELEKMKDSGELLTILKQFGFTEQELPGDAKTAELCAG
ncbi:ectoine/hydroxyectoine ABC transporter substrate-binding protein EhuB [Paenibacillus sp. MWE-103]|uniref:Ectoine/hydroxyectoine ABC transporter substrate-binding protein EhuB n=1 Tax=Paenibacillus artemisiicola TaxID=1172618 RepID=A0ABS3WBR1_9BACL|nr:ectoine/hydroxyectoine ABC transporter substrate-binding protein EhuB [Paenibacillus artemisiicola]MBO7745757.1 ectoine/hydroxyectoine ABC transporter substrate-binding protein EhuB [Paenibacillus artemisiicola]